MSLLPTDALLFLCLVALFTGFIKAGMPSLGTLLTASVALMFPPRDALGITLLYLLVGDMVAVTLYWRLAHWQELKKMLIPVVAGIWPFISLRNAEFLANEMPGVDVPAEFVDRMRVAHASGPDAEMEEGVAIALEMIEATRCMVGGFHLAAETSYGRLAAYKACDPPPELAEIIDTLLDPGA